jgi:hypothetical protein
VLIPEKLQHRVVEYDRAGNVLGQVAVEDPIAAVRLGSGNLLVTSMSQKRALEYDPAGKLVWSYYHPDSRVTRAFRR